jgi:hypothetical protein
MRLALAALAGVALAAGCGGGSSAPPTTTPRPQPQIRVTLAAPTHLPRAKEPWIYTVRVTDAQGRPLPARIRMQVLFGGVPVGKVDEGRTFRFVGVWREPKSDPVIWPAQSRGHRLTFQAIVTAKGVTRTLNYWIRVR